MSCHAPAGRRSFLPGLVVEVKAIACELPANLGIPLARAHVSHIRDEHIRDEVLARGLTAAISGTTIWRRMAEDAIRLWSHRSWILPRDPAFPVEAGSVLDLDAGVCDGQPLGPDDYVLSETSHTQTFLLAGRVLARAQRPWGAQIPRHRQSRHPPPLPVHVLEGSGPMPNSLQET